MGWAQQQAPSYSRHGSQESSGPIHPAEVWPHRTPWLAGRQCESKVLEYGQNLVSPPQPQSHAHPVIPCYNAIMCRANHKRTHNNLPAPVCSPCRAASRCTTHTVGASCHRHTGAAPRQTGRSTKSRTTWVRSGNHTHDKVSRCEGAYVFHALHVRTRKKHQPRNRIPCRACVSTGRKLAAEVGKLQTTRTATHPEQGVSPHVHAGADATAVESRWRSWLNRPYGVPELQKAPPVSCTAQQPSSTTGRGRAVHDKRTYSTTGYPQARRRIGCGYLRRHTSYATVGGTACMSGTLGCHRRGHTMGAFQWISITAHAPT